MTTATERVLQQKLGGLKLDWNFVDDLGKDLNMEYDWDNINDINMIIMYMLEEHIDNFVDEYSDELEKLGVDIEIIRGELYDSIYTNYLDSGLDYKNENEEVQKLIEDNLYF